MLLSQSFRPYHMALIFGLTASLSCKEHMTTAGCRPLGDHWDHSLGTGCPSWFQWNLSLSMIFLFQQLSLLAMIMAFWMVNWFPVWIICSATAENCRKLFLGVQMLLISRRQKSAGSLYCGSSGCRLHCTIYWLGLCPLVLSEREQMVLVGLWNTFTL